MTASTSPGDPAPEDGAPIALPEAQWQALQDAYATPPRAYHHCGHVCETLAHYRVVAREASWAAPVEVWLAPVSYTHLDVYKRQTRSSACSSRSTARTRRRRGWRRCS